MVTLTGKRLNVPSDVVTLVALDRVTHADPSETCFRNERIILIFRMHDTESNYRSHVFIVPEPTLNKDNTILFPLKH